MSDSDREYDVIIIGGGPAGLSAGIYTARAGLSSLLIEKAIIGGQILNTEQVENYPGFPESISGEELTKMMYQQATKFGIKTVVAETTGIELRGDKKVVKTAEGDYIARVVIVASGSERIKLGVPGEAEFIGRGVSYCATCDAVFFREKTVVVVGGGDAAITEALHLSKFASRVMVVHRRNQLRATRILQDKAFSEPKIEFVLDTVVEEITGDDFVQKIRLRKVTDGQESILDVQGVFVSIGFKPNTGYLKDILKLDAGAAVITDGRLATEVPGIFAVGDIRSNSARQVITAAGDGAGAAIYAEKYLTNYG